jgi:hypothetical protein
LGKTYRNQKSAYEDQSDAKKFQKRAKRDKSFKIKHVATDKKKFIEPAALPK